MGDWPAMVQEYNRVVISTGSEESIGGELAARNTGPVVGAWPTANRAIYIPFVVHRTFTADVMFVEIGTASGNIDLGIYDTGGNKLVTMGSTAAAGATATQTLDITDTTLYPGVYYMAAAADNTTVTMLRSNAAAEVQGASGVLMQSSAFPLPSTATYAQMADAYCPIIVISGRTVV